MMKKRSEKLHHPVPTSSTKSRDSASHQRLRPWSRPDGGHGSLCGADSPNSSSQFEGLYGRIFRTLPPGSFNEDELLALARLMTADPEVVQDSDGKAKRDEDGRLIPTATPETKLDDEENLGIPAGYTYLGQFIDHDITFDPTSSLQKQNDPDALVDFRTPRLDLDCVYGRGPADQPYMFEPDGLHFRLGTDLTRNGKPTNVKDLPRINRRAIIGDKRNDENVIVSQLQGVFLQFHNAMADELNGPSPNFQDVQRLVQWHYQWVVLHDFLPKIVGDRTLHKSATTS
jgi:Animal haem peroxidase